MLFNSHEFLFVFLPITLVGFLLIHLYSRRLALAWVTGASLVFYSYWDYRYLALIIPSIIINCALGYLIARHWSRAWLIVGVTANLLAIAWFKYSLFLYIVATGNATPPDFLKNIALPLGISFFTFQQIAYLVNVWRGHEQPARLETHAFIVLFFPHLIAGPIVLYENIVSQVRRQPRVAGYLSASFRIGLLIFAIGLFKKVIVADSLAPYANAIFDFAARPDYDLSGRDAWAGAAAYTLQLYFDFSGYSDMAVGLGRMFGFRLPMNFNSPYKALSIIDFWRRWHITLTSFFRNYVYIPMGGNRKGPHAQILFILIVFFLTGLWHGAGWAFIAWGVLHGILVAANHLWARTRIARALRSSSRSQVRHTYLALSWALTMLSVMVLWVFFRADSWSTGSKIIKAMFTFSESPGRAIADLNVYIMLIPALFILFVICWWIPNSLEITRWVRRNSKTRPSTSVRSRSRKITDAVKQLIYPTLVGASLYLSIASIGYVKNQFLYFNF